MASRPVTLILVAVAVVTAGCGRSSPSTSSKATAPPGSPDATSHVAKPVAATPSKSAQMICSPEAQQEILASATETRTTQPVVPTWKQHVYSCRYIYGTDVMVLSVKELANKRETDDYVASLEHRLGVARIVRPLGEDAFVTKGGSAVVRKDFKVLLVDVSGLPQRFGPSSETRDGVALAIAETIMGCWTGA